MNKDLIYIFDKITFKRQELGEIQSNFNMSITIDGTKDSTKMVVWSFNESEIEPNTICWHAKTGTWWIVAHDKIERYLNENETFIYIHNLQLEGAIELLNARDLTDCGFNQNTYTKGEFLNRLIKLSSFEFKDDDITIVGQGNFGNQKVDYVKTFENYSLLSAIREFLDSYNMCGKLEFTTRVSGNNTYLDKAILYIINKTGDNTLTTHTMSEFDDVRETKNMDKNSFGTIVVSNAENVISSATKTFPSTGSVKASGTEYNIHPNNAVIRLPSNVFKGNWLKLIPTINDVTITVNQAGNLYNATYNFNATSDDSLENVLQKILDFVYDNNIDDLYDNFLAAFNENKQLIKNNLISSSTVTLYNGNQLNPTNGKIIKGDNVPYVVIANYVSKLLNGTGVDKKPLIFCDKETRETLPLSYQGIKWERGSNVISGFDCFTAVSGSTQTLRVDLEYTDYQKSQVDILTVNSGQSYARIDLNATLNLHFQLNPLHPNYGDLQFIVNYIPMSDIKVKVDNSRTKRDMHLYNQNGKLTDNFALSKMLNSYSKEISSDTITKYKWYYSFNDVPKVGSMVTTTSNEIYVINNVSLDFTQNEKDNNDFGYIIECEITMSKYVSTKSLMVNPNTNIRDYGIPQNFNVKRKQLYRDYYEFGYSLNSDADNNYYIDPQRMFNIGRESNNRLNLIGVIRCDYKEAIGGNIEQDVSAQSSWYYQLETTLYYMNKMVYVVLDFNDNNIIGYSNQNVWSGFKIERILSGSYDDINTPISYVDGDGQVEHIYIKLCDNEQLTTIYDYYQDTHGGSSWKGSLYNYSCFIPSEIYEGLASGDYTMLISEPYYNKDAIEVPVFEYACQVDDSNEVLIGDNILTQHENCIYFYHFIIGDNLTQDNVIDNTSIELPTLQNPYRYRMYDSATITYNDLDTNVKALYIRLYNHTQYDRNTNTWSDYTLNNFQEGKDVAIFRHAYNLVTGEETVELMLIAKKIPSSNISPDRKIALLVLNHYKLN